MGITYTEFGGITMYVGIPENKTSTIDAGAWTGANGDGAESISGADRIRFLARLAAILSVSALVTGAVVSVAERPQTPAAASVIKTLTR